MEYRYKYKKILFDGREVSIKVLAEQASKFYVVNNEVHGIMGWAEKIGVAPNTLYNKEALKGEKALLEYIKNRLPPLE